MKPNDLDEFTALLTGIADYYGKTLAPASIQLYWNALKGMELYAVKCALNQHVQLSRFMPSIAEVLEAVRVLDGRPEAEAAWACVARSLNDEGVTIVWTEEMAGAFGVALGLQEDRVAARMAFKETYERLVQEARAQGKPVKWSASLGHDAMGREGPLMEGVRQGKLPSVYVAGLLPSNVTMSPEVRALLDGEQKKQLAA